MKVFRKIWHFCLWVVHHAITVLASILLALLLSIFLFFVFVKTNPRGAEKFVSSGLTKVMSFVKVESSIVKTQIADDNIQVTVDNFTRQTKGVKLNGDGVVVKFSLNDIMHGRLYTINIKQFAVTIITNSETGAQTQNGDRQILTAMYSLIPSVRVEIDDFILNVNGNEVHLSNSLLVLNQGGYVIWVSTKSQEEKYKIHMALNSNILRISFSDVPKTFLSNYLSEAFKFINFDTVSGFVEFNTKNLAEFQYRVALDSLTLIKSNAIASNFLMGKVVVSGEGGKFGINISVPDIVFKKDGKIALVATIGKQKQSIAVKLENVEVDDIKPLVPWNFIKKTQFSGLTFYLVNALKSGYLQDVLVNVNLPIKKPDDLIVKVSFKSTEFEYDDNFASVQNGHGIVDVNAERTIVLLDNATTAGNKLNFTRVDVDHHKNIVNVNSALSGTPFGIASVLLPKVELQNYTHLVNATMDARINLKLDLKLDLKCKNIFECSSFDVISDVNFLTSFLNQKTIATGFLNVSKKVNENIVSELKLSDFANQYFVVSSITSEINIDVLKHIFEMKAKVLDNDKEVIDIKSFVFNAKKNMITTVNMPKILFGKNNFSIFYNGASLKITGKTVSLPSMQDLLLRVQNNHQNKTQKGHTVYNINTDINIANMLLYNDIQTPLVLKLQLNNGEIDMAFLDTDLIKFHYFNSNAFDMLTQEYQKEGMFLDIPNLGTLASALNETPSPSVRSGNISIIGKREEDGEVVWSGYLRNFHIKMKKFGFHPLKSKINVVYKNHIISFKDLKMRDKNHTVFFTGNINTQSFVTNAKIFYTPSKVEFLNEIPFLKDAFKLTTLGGSKKGLVSLELDATGSIFEPTIKFKKSSSVTSLWKFSIGVVLLPLLLL